MTVKGGTTPACAACKYQRRKCTPSCPLAPYFPANQPKMFQNVHRLFGVSNITKTLNSLKTKDQKEDAMKSIIYEAEMRERFPVYGCSMIIYQLRFQLYWAQQELHAALAHLAAVRDQNDAASAVIQRQSVSNELPPFNTQFSFNESPSGFYGDSPEYMGRPLLGLDSCTESSLTAIQSQMDALSILQDNRSIFSNDFDGAQSYIDTKEPFESSPESSLKNNAIIQQVEQIPDRELKTAAAGFSLTTLN